MKAKPAAKAKAKTPARAKPVTRAKTPVKAKKAPAKAKPPVRTSARPSAKAAPTKAKAPARSSAKAPAAAKTRAKAEATPKAKAPARKKPVVGKPANPRSKTSRPARPDGRTGTFKFRASPKPAAAPVEIAAAPAPVIPAELLVDPPKPAKPRKARGKKEEAEPRRPDSALGMILAQLEDSKAEQVVTITLDDKSAIADTMVVATGRSNRHVGAIADQLVEKLKAAGRRDLKIEGMPQCDWVLVDAGDVVVHIFRPEVRSFYNLEKLWSDHAPNERLVT